MRTRQALSPVSDKNLYQQRKGVWGGEVQEPKRQFVLPIHFTPHLEIYTNAVLLQLGVNETNKIEKLR